MQRWGSIIRIVLVFVVAVAISTLLYAFKPTPARRGVADARPLVRVVTVQPETATVTLHHFGTVQPRISVRLLAEVGGRILFLADAFRKGAYLPKGTEIARIDPVPLKLERDRQRAQIKALDADLRRLNQEERNLTALLDIVSHEADLARTDYERFQKLSPRQLVARSNLDQAQSRYLAATERTQNMQNQIALIPITRTQVQAQKAQAQTLLKQAQHNLEKSVIALPFDAWVVERTVDIDQIVAAGAPIGDIYAKGAYEVEISLPAEELPWVPPLSTDRAVLQAMIRPADGQGDPWPGRVARIGAQTDPATRTLPLIVEVDIPEEGLPGADIQRLRPGMFVNIDIHGRQLKNVFRLARATLKGDHTLFVVRKGQLFIQDVDVIWQDQESVLVQKGLKPGDTVVVSPVAAPQDGMAVRVES